MTTAYAYLRVSGDAQADRGLPIAGQREAVQAHADAHGIQIARWFVDEARPGSSDVHRDAFQQMMRLAHEDPPPVGAVILWSWSRFARDSDDAHFWKASLRRHGLEVLSVAEPVPDNLPAGFEYVLESAIHWSDARRLEEISHDARRGQQALARAGFVPSGGPVPPGYKTEFVDTEIGGRPRRCRRWVLDPETAPLVRRAWDMRLAGASYRAIWEETRLYARPHGYTSMFSNPIYKGEWAWGSVRVPMEAIVTPEEWAIVHAAGENRRSGAYARRKGSPFLLSGLVRCGKCGAMLIGSRSRGRLRKDGRRRDYAYYICHHRRIGQCDLPSAPAGPLERAVVAALFETVLTPESVTRLSRDAAARRQEREGTLGPQIEQAEAAVRRLEGAITQLLDALERSASVSLGRRLEEREAELAGAQETLRALQAEASYGEESVDLAGLRGILREAMEDWETPRRRALLEMFVVGVEVVGQGEGLLRYKLPFAFRL